MSAVPPPPPGAAPASRPPGPLFARPARRRNGHRILDGLEAVRRARARYPDARATREDRRRLSHGVDYALHGLGDPLAVRRDEHRLLVATQMLSYLRVCDRIVRGYEQCAGLRRYLHKTLLQFEHPWIRDLSEAYPVRTLIGAQFASDVAVTPGPAPAQARFQTLEVNFGAVGRIAEGARAQAAFPGTPFPASAREVMAHMLASLDAYYYHACGILGIAPKPLAARRLVLVENDGWYLGPVCIAEAFARLGVPVVVAPREALRYDPDANRLYLQTAAGPEPVDQVFLDFGYVEDLPTAPEAGAPTAGRQPPGAAITRALANRAVVAESCVLVQTVLGAKTTQALIDHLVRHPAHPFVAQLGIERTDLRSLEGMAPPTHQWGPAYFAARGINGFRVREYLAQASLVAKATAGGFYGGRGVYLLAGPAAVRRRFWAAVRRTLWQALARFQERAGPAALIRFLRIAVVGPAAEAELRQHLDLQTGGAVAGTRRGRHLAQVCRALRVPRPRDAPAAEASGLRSGGAAGGAGGLSDAEEARLQALHHALHPHAAPAKDPPELLVADVDALLTELCWALRRVVDGPGPGAGAPAAELRQRCYERMATRLFLPYVLQEHVPADWRVDGEPIELRVAGTVGQEVDEFCAVVTASRKGVGDEPPKVIYPITAPAAPPPRDRDVDGR